MLFIWPFLLLAFGLVFIALGDLGLFSFLFWPLAIIAFLMLVFRSSKTNHESGDRLTWLLNLRSNVTIVSIGLLTPIFVRYLIESLQSTPLIGMILGLFIGFGLAISGLFTTNNRTIVYSNILGGLITLGYVYVNLWTLGDLARVITASFGLLVAVVVSIVKLKDKLS